MFDLAPGAPGDPGDTDPKPKAAPPQPEEEEATLSERGEFMTQCLYEQLGESRADGLAHSLINSIGAEDQEANLERFGQQNNVGAVVDTVSQVYAEYQTAAVDYVSKQTGEDGMKILEWAYGEFDRESWQQVSRLHFFQKSMAGYDAIVREYRKHQAKQR